MAIELEIDYRVGAYFYAALPKGDKYNKRDKQLMLDYIHVFREAG